jgi:hypothetical protein
MAMVNATTIAHTAGRAQTGRSSRRTSCTVLVDGDRHVLFGVLVAVDQMRRE